MFSKVGMNRNHKSTCTMFVHTCTCAHYKKHGCQGDYQCTSDFVTFEMNNPFSIFCGYHFKICTILRFTPPPAKTQIFPSIPGYPVIQTIGKFFSLLHHRLTSSTKFILFSVEGGSINVFTMYRIICNN